jgi:phosphoribosylformimino-5-aminoimidazole carboxamide ribotide isomerase
MEFRPCIDIHDGKVKQIVGGSLNDDGAKENFVSVHDASYYAAMYRADGLCGGHVIMLNHRESPYYEATKSEAKSALRTYPGGLMAGGGITPENASEFLDAGASHVIVTSYVFSGGMINYDRLRKMFNAVGREHLVLDLSCRKRGGKYFVVTDRWQRFTDEEVTYALLEHLSGFCSEFLIHAVDVEGRACGIETELVRYLGGWGKLPVTYAGGISSFDDLKELNEAGDGRLDATIGSALDIFGGHMEYRKVIDYLNIL